MQAALASRHIDGAAVPEVEAVGRVKNVAVVAAQERVRVGAVQLLEGDDEAVSEVDQVRLVLGLHLDHVLLQTLLVRRQAHAEQLYLVGVKFDLVLLDLDFELIGDCILHVLPIIKRLVDFLLLFGDPIGAVLVSRRELIGVGIALGLSLLGLTGPELVDALVRDAPVLEL